MYAALEGKKEEERKLKNKEKMAGSREQRNGRLAELYCDVRYTFVRQNTNARIIIWMVDRVEDPTKFFNFHISTVGVKCALLRHRRIYDNSSECK